MKKLDKKFKNMVDTLKKSGQEIKDEMTPQQAHELHMVMGISGEAGELLDAFKKYIIYGKPLDMENVVEELGDLEFYMEGLRSQLGIRRNATLKANIKKLSARYHNLVYSNQAAIDRADKK